MSLQEWAGVPDYDPRATLAVVFTDIIDSTTLTRTVGDRAMFDLLVNHFESARTCLLADFDAIEIKLIGDAYMAAFRTSDAALQFALMFRANTGDPRIGIRVGIHVGQVRIKDDIYGLMVNYAARLAHIKVSGEEGIFLSASAKRDIESEYGIGHQDFGLFRLSPTQLQGFGPREDSGKSSRARSASQGPLETGRSRKRKQGRIRSQPWLPSPNRSKCQRYPSTNLLSGMTPSLAYRPVIRTRPNTLLIKNG